jgi:hypothetical protein
VETKLQHEFKSQNPAGNLAYGSASLTSAAFLAQLSTNGLFIYALPGRADRRYLLIQNQSTTVAMFLSFVNLPGAASGVQILPLGNYEPLIAPISDLYIVATAAAAGIIVEG